VKKALKKNIISDISYKKITHLKKYFQNLGLVKKLYIILQNSTQLRRITEKLFLT